MVGEEEGKPPKKPRGNPNFQKNRRNPYYDDKASADGKKDDTQTDTTTTTDNTKKMADEATTDTTDSTSTVESQNTGNTGGESRDVPIDIFSDAMPGTEELPLDGEVKTNAYGNNVGEGNGNQGGGGNNGGGTGTASTASETTGNTGNPGQSNQPGVQQPVKSAEEIKTEAEQLVKLLMKGYEKLHGLGRWAGKQDPAELTDLHLAGKINLHQELPLGRKTITVQQFFAEYNEGIDENIVVTDEFKESITPPLVRIAIKRGWTLGDELYVAMLVSEDLATKASMLIGLKKSASLVLEACHELMKKQRKANDPPPNPEPNPRPEQPNDESVPFEEVPNDGWREDAHQ